MDDRFEIQMLVARYAHASDDRDVDRMVACFTPDAEFTYEGSSRVVGEAELRTYYGKAFERKAASTHLMTNVVIDIKGDQARGKTSAVAFLSAHDRDTVVMRGLRYDDVFVRTPAGWCISKREHRCFWQCEAPGGLVDLGIRNPPADSRCETE
jgi:uncharacterized protein (TIGR02246 family)